MARPREFDEQQTLDKALAVFWDKGFDGASITDLTDATGVGRASLYAAYGDKEGIFRAAIEHYKAKLASAVTPVSEAASGEQWLRCFFHGVATLAQERASKGCFVQLAMSQCDQARAQTRALLAEALHKTEGLLRDATERCIREGSLDERTDPQEVVAFLMVVLHGINASARIGADAAKLEQACERALGAIGLGSVA